MKQISNNLQDVKLKIIAMKGKTFNFEVNTGRKKIINFTATIENAYPSIFTVKVVDENIRYNYSYNEILCGDVKITKCEQNLMESMQRVLWFSIYKMWL